MGHIQQFQNGFISSCRIHSGIQLEKIISLDPGITPG
jgi:hypothetical protein